MLLSYRSNTRQHPTAFYADRGIFPAIPLTCLEPKDTNIFSVTSSGTTPFLAACEGGRVDVARSLMEKATTLEKLEEMCNAKDATGKTPFDMAAAGQHKVQIRRPHVFTAI